MTAPRMRYCGHGEYDEEPDGMLYYVRVLPRLVRFLKLVDRRRAKP